MALPPEPSVEEGTSTPLFPKGQLKIFLGASPGVGKTFAMLQAAAERKQEGIDVVVGLVETHKRKETEDQLANLEVMPRKVISYKGRSFEELDLDGILARAPKLVLIDECAHSNLPGSRHPKRYNDIMEILEHGIDVYTTLNIQHFESLKDIVEQMTHVVVRETIPDSFIKSADEVQLIDLPPDDLLQRLADGKVYIPEQAKAAVEHFFSRSNLLTLRELALRHAVSVADEEMAHYVQQQGITGPWPASDKVMVCVSPNAPDADLVRFARRIADRMQAKWIAVTVETPDDESRSLSVQQQLSQNLQLAEKLGANVVALDGSNIADTLVHYASTQNVTDMVVGQHQKAKGWHKLPIIRWLILGPSIAEQILAHDPPLILRVIPTLKQEAPIKDQGPSKSLFKMIKPYVTSLAITLGMLFAAGQIHKHTSVADVSVLFFLSILWVAIKFEMGPTIFATTISSFVYDYFFIHPKHHFALNSLEGWLTFLSFIFSAVIICNLASHSRTIFSASQGRLRQARFFSRFVHQLTLYSTPDEILHHLCQDLHRFLNIRVIAFWDVRDKTLEPVAQSPKSQHISLSDVDASAMQWALAHKTRSGRSTDNFSDASYLYLPLKIGNNSMGVIGIWALKSSLTIDDFRIAQTLIDQAALAIDRLRSLGKKGA